MLQNRKHEGEHEIEIIANNKRERSHELLIMIFIIITVNGTTTKGEQKWRKEVSPKLPSRRRSGRKLKSSDSSM